VPALNWGLSIIPGIMHSCARRGRTDVGHGLADHGKEGPLVQTEAQACGRSPRSVFPALTSRTFIGCWRRDVRRYWALSLWPDLVYAIHHQGSGLSRQTRCGLDFDPAVGVLAPSSCSDRVISQVLMARGVTRVVRAGVLGSVPLIVGGLILAVCPHVEVGGMTIGLLVVSGRGCADRSTCLPADARRVHAGTAARRGDRDLRRDLHAGRHFAPFVMGQCDPARGGAARRLHDRLHINAVIMVVSGLLACCCLWPNTSAPACSAGGAAEVCVNRPFRRPCESRDDSSPVERSAIRERSIICAPARITLRLIRATLADGLRCTGPGVRPGRMLTASRLSLLQTSLARRARGVPAARRWPCHDVASLRPRRWWPS